MSEREGGARLPAVGRTVRLAMRRLRREPGFVAPVLCTLALGFGALLAVFTLVDGVLLRPLPYADPSRLVQLRHSLPGFDVAETGQSGGTISHYSEASRVFELTGAYFDRELSITDGAMPQRVVAALATPSLFAVLGVQPQLGRLFGEADADGRFVLISHDLWVSRFGADPAIVGRTLETNRQLSEIVGVMPPHFDFPARATQLWMAARMEADGAELRDMYMEAVARLRPGVTSAAAEAELGRLIRTLPDRFGDVTPALLEESRVRPLVVPLGERIMGDVRPVLLLLLYTALFVLLAALANVANLTVARAERQRREIAVERVLGAGRGAVLGRFVAENALLALAGGAAGIALAWAAVAVRFGFAEWQLPRLAAVAVGGRTLLLWACLTVATAMFLSWLAYVRAGRGSTDAMLRGGAGRITGSVETQAVQRLLAASQVALACALLIGAAVMVQSVRALHRVELGFQPAGVTAFDLSLPTRAYPSYADAAGFFERVTAALRAVPGVTAAGAVSMLPLRELPPFFDMPVSAPDRPVTEGAEPLATVLSTTPEYFGVLGIPLLSGRLFDAHDLRDGSAGVVLSASLARALFGAADPIGRNVRTASTRSGQSLTVLGVVGDVRGSRLTGPFQPVLYLPATDGSRLPGGAAPLPILPRELTVVVRATLPPEVLAAEIRRIVKDADPYVPVADLRALDASVARAAGTVRLTTVLLLAAAGVVLLLGVIGIYGVVAYTVGRRMPELALRAALGARPRILSALVLRYSVGLALVGTAAGLPLALLLTRGLGALLFEVDAQDPRVFAAVPLLLLLAAAAAALRPAWRAMTVAPAETLRRD